ncbi:hypothetical protein DFJ73DRAFT_959807 [Zopfochytrium polystomum]|nr:hypothetical protein DFJ73DRAFT_959807 [Zopfochytrium polystomum]
MAPTATTIAVALLVTVVPVALFLLLRSLRTSSSSSSFKGKLVVVTGASRGIGEKIAYEFARRNATLVLAARTVSKLDPIAEKCRALGATAAHVVPFDASSRASCEAMIRAAAALAPSSSTSGLSSPRIDCLVLNHCTTLYANFFALEDADAGSTAADPYAGRLASMEECIGVNYYGFVHLALAALPYLQTPTTKVVGAHGGGVQRTDPSTLMIVSSLASRVTPPNVATYAASKAALDTFFGCLRHDLRTREHALEKAARGSGNGGAAPGFVAAAGAAGLAATATAVRHVRISRAVLGAIATENLKEVTTKEVDALAVSPELTAKRIVQGCVDGTAVFFYPLIIRASLVIQVFSEDLAFWVLRKAHGLS